MIPYIHLSGTGITGAVIGTISRKAKSDYNGQQYNVYVDSGYDIDVAEYIRLTPLVSLEWNCLQLQSHIGTETGALNLNVRSQDYDILQSGLGAGISADVGSEWRELISELHAGWLYDFMNGCISATAAFTGGGALFETNWVKTVRHSFDVGSKLGMDFKNDISMLMECDTQLKKDFFGIYGYATLRYRFWS